VDVISAEEMLATGSPDMDTILSTVVPSYNVNAQPISDAATLVRPANLRGLPPDNTLVLVNGKRRHRSAVITFLGGGISDGSQGPDISVIPGIALKQVEVLRDGAAAQYGSDAIAGVINFQLRDDASGGTFQARYGEFYEGDGETMRYSGNVGMPLTDRGFANFSFEYKEVNPTSRSVQRDDAAALIAAGNTNVANPAQVWGTPDVKNDFTLFGNFGLDLGNNKEAYMFGNWSERTVEGGFFFRNPNTRGGVFSGDGGATLLIGDLDGVGTGGTCPTVNIVNDVPDPVALAQVFSDPNCFSFQEMFPGGFTPRFGGDVTDVSLAMGTRGEFANGTGYDFSVTLGRNQVDFFIKNTVNASLGPNTPTSFEPGSYIQLEKTFNADFTKDHDIKGLYSPLSFSYGLEFREESFEIINGDKASFEVGPLADQGFGIGSNGFPGFKPADAGVFTRRNYALYADAEANVTENLLLGGALRYEDFYTDFGDTLDGKVTFRYDMTENWKLRGSASTGFRAPTVGQANVRNVTTQFVPGQGLSDQATLPPTNPIAVQKGGKQLQPEDSKSYTLGLAGELGDVFVTLDVYHIEVTDRIGQVSPQTLTPTDIAALQALGIQDASSFTSVTFFANAFDTTTTGVDLVLNYSREGLGGENNFAFVANYNKTEVDRFDPNVISQTRIRQLEENLPKTRGTFTWQHDHGKWNSMVRVNYYGSYYEAHLDAGSLPINAGAEYTVDAEFRYQLTSSTRIKVGAQNLFDEFPDENPWAGVAGAKYPPTSPMGFNGGFWYVEAEYTWD
jgi:iron complex outermembrane receptor protein